MVHNSSSDSWLYEDGYAAGEKAGEIKGAAEERKAIREWIKENRSYTELEAGIGITRDHFTSNDLIAFLDSRK